LEKKQKNWRKERDKRKTEVFHGEKIKSNGSGNIDIM
jgi:hypothetical protein